ncbi:gem-associated protein 6-like [Gigantopelta aegis]|uniref:gem-associated protein 6-like n=1 Tax=Gigantopelta aegis TaxID=1735272 RepID=UPI001B88C14A|nr:gem-associated protein 6-like [Gigantopelta aegis]
MGEEGNEVHPVFHKDPEDWMQYVYKQVRVLTADGVEHIGWVYTIDPVSETFVLVQFVDDQPQLDILMGHAVTKVIVIDENTEAHKEKLDCLFRPDMFPAMSSEDVKKQQMLVKSWLDKNRVPVQVSGVGDELLMISDALVIEPPYGVGNCCSTNEIILSRIQGLLKNMPENLDEW